MMIPLSVLGIKDEMIKKYQSKKIKDLEDLITYLPRRYDDLTAPKTVDQLVNGEFAAIYGIVTHVKETPKMISFNCKDVNQQWFSVTFFGKPGGFYYKRKELPVGTWFLFGGKVKFSPDGRFISIVSPEYAEKNWQEATKIYPIYKKIHKDISKEALKEHIQKALTIHDMNDYLEPELFYRWSQETLPGFEYPLLPRANAFRWVHAPRTLQEMEQAQYRLAFDELFRLAYQLHQDGQLSEEAVHIDLVHLEESRAFIKSLPFKLTPGQFEVLQQMVATIKQGRLLQALVQGDVGCGKTMVAIIMMLTIVENGYQAALMAPTNVLAVQHSLEIKKMLEGWGYPVVLLNGDMKAKEKKEALAKIKSGEARFVVGTHALLSDKVEFENLGLVIIDEEHRFGVKQREVLKARGSNLNFISMTATPIPRTLASSLYNKNIQTFSIKSLPAGRQPIQTYWIQEKEQMIEHMLQEIQKGRQAYIICPFVEKNEKMKDIMGIEECQKWIETDPRMKHLRVGFVHGKSDIATIVDAFKNKELDVLIATTVIEVGVNVPNATIITILNAERFGLAQLHQLRGRVGRGSFASYCYLQSANPTPDGQKKLQAMTESTDGFYLSQVDLSLRGAGNLVGDSQSGFEKSFMLLMKYPQLFEIIQREIEEIFNDEERLAHYKRLFKE